MFLSLLELVVKQGDALQETKWASEEGVYSGPQRCLLTRDAVAQPLEPKNKVQSELAVTAIAIRSEIAPLSHNLQ